MTERESRVSGPGAAVLCVERQNGVLGPASVLPALAADTSALVDNIKRLLDAARPAGVRVVHATYEGALGGDHSGTARIWRRLGPATASWGPGTPDTRVVDGLLHDTDLVVPRHHGLFPTLDTELLPLLRGFGVHTVILAGVSLNLALPFTAGHLTQSGFHLVIPRDAVGGTPPEYGTQVLDNSLAFLGRLTTVDELIGEWQVAARAAG
ncbi:cysteine hydrolase [Mycolicibacterium thermoresistibile]